MTPKDLPEAFYIDMAVGVHAFDELCQMYEVPQALAASLEQDSEFQRRHSIAKQAVEDDGRAFRARCRTVVNNNVAHMQQIMRDPDTPASTQLDAFKTLAKFGDLEPDRARSEGYQGPHLTLNIVAPDGASAMSLDVGSAQDDVIEHEPRSPEELPLMSPDESEGWGA